MAIDFIPKIEYGTIPTTITFRLPPEGRDPLGRQVTLKGDVSESSSGITQTSIDYLEEVFRVKFYDLNYTEISTLETFFTTHAVFGENFKYYPDKNVASYYTVTLDKREFRPEGEYADPENTDFRYTLAMTMRRVYA